MSSRELVPGELPFCKMELKEDEKPKLLYWVPMMTGSYGEDCAIGRYYAQSMIDYLSGRSDEVGNHMLLTEIIKSMKFDGSTDAVNDGFLSVITEKLTG